MKSVWFCAVVGLMLFAQPAFAAFGISSVSGQVEEVSAPSSAVKGAYTSADNIRLWYEGPAVLASPLATDHNGTPGTYTFFGLTPTPGSVSGQVGSYMVHLDPGSIAADRWIGSVTFSNKILGVMFTIPNLVGSDSALGGSTTYGSGNNRGLELNEGNSLHQYDDIFSISADGKTLSLDLKTGTRSYDEMRVVTAVPELATIGTWGLLGLGLAVAIRRKWIAK